MNSNRLVEADMVGSAKAYCVLTEWWLQVRNLASCIKAAIDFVSPESFQHVLDLTQERRMLTLQEAIIKPEEAEVAPTERRHADKLQALPSANFLQAAVAAALRLLPRACLTALQDLLAAP